MKLVDQDGAMAPVVPRVSVIMPVYNGEGFIARALDSLFAQTLSNFELILIDDGSRDATLDRAAPWLGDRRASITPPRR
jgi:glycosyltransferase involved in cell wall biosynthesis